MFKYGGGIYHGVVLSDADYEIIKKHNLTVVTCPGSNTKLSSGIADTDKMLQNGVNVAIGTDGPASNNGLDMFKEMWLVSGLQKLIHNDPSVMDAEEVFKMATINGYKAQGRNDCGSIKVGNKADLIVLDMTTPNMYPDFDILNNLVYSANKSNVVLTMVDGEVLYKNGEFTTIDVERMGYEVSRLVREVVNEVNS